LANVDSEIQSIKQLNNSIISSLIVLLIVAGVLSAFLANRIIKPVREAYDKQVFFVQDASHEMRTPLAIIKGKLELLANAWGETIEDNFEHISKMMSEVRGLEKLNSDLLLLTKEDLNSSVKLEDINLKDFVEDISEFYY
jgi:signal transduction histidine kinase